MRVLTRPVQSKIDHTRACTHACIHRHLFHHHRYPAGAEITRHGLPDAVYIATTTRIEKRKKKRSKSTRMAPHCAPRAMVSAPTNDDTDDGAKTAYDARKRTVWDDVDDLRGDAHYAALGVRREATRDELKSAFIRAAREHHPDKGGDARTFAKVRKAYEVLSDPAKRRTYDSLMTEIQYRYIRGVTQRAPGGEDVLLDDIERLGLGTICGDTQLVTLCEVCGRPSTRVCYACTALYCDFCERKMHWKGDVGLHWPVQHVEGHMARQLGKKELENKIREDAERAMREAPNYRNEYELKDSRTFKEIAAEVYHPDGRHRHVYDIRLAKHYMWAQSLRSVYIAVNIPTGYADKHLHYEFSRGGILLQPEDSLAVIDRELAYTPDDRYPVEVYVTDDKRAIMLEIRKARIGEDWKKLFVGDPDYARHLEPPYEMTESNEEAIMEFELPFWIDAEDVGVSFNSKNVRVKVAGEFDITREFWKKEKEKPGAKPWDAIDVSECCWSLDDGVERETGDPCKSLMITLAKPKPDKHEIQYKRGQRVDNRNIYMNNDQQGARFFIDDNDAYGGLLEAMLQAQVFIDTGSTWRPALPHETYKHPFMKSRRVDKLEDLSESTRGIIEALLKNKRFTQEESDEFDNADVVDERDLVW